MKAKVPVVPHMLCGCACLLMVLANLALPVAAQGSQTEEGVRKEASRLHALFAREWQFRLQSDPLLATSVGVADYDAQLPTVTVEEMARQVKVWQGFLAELKTIDRKKLSEADLINYEVFQRQLTEMVEDFEFGGYRIPILVDSGFHISFARLPGEMPFNSVTNYENYIARLKGFPRYVAQHIELMREGLQHSMTLPKVVLQGYEVTISSHVVTEVEESLFFKPFAKLPTTFPQEERQRLIKAGQEAILGSVVPGYQTFLDFMVQEYIPGARESLGAREFPNGEAYYAQRIRHFTTLDMSAEEIHQTGLEEVARIRAEMEEIIRQVEFKGDFAEFLQFLRTDPRFYPKTAEELLKEASYISKQMDAKLPALFGRLPRLPYGVAPVPDHLAPKYTTGRYVRSPPGSTEPGYYWVNTYALESRPLYVLTALSLHEAVPGHHLQISLAQELENLPNFRRYSYISAFGEGWGLYAEWLGLEAGMYKDPYSQFGRLTYEMWRACRLVVDTGVHVMGWTRQQMMDYMAANTALSLHEVTTETDRYISWPGQALSYKLGELTIKRLRREAEDRLGEHFDLREFHDVVLANGSVPLSVLEGVVDRYVEQRLSKVGAMQM